MEAGGGEVESYFWTSDGPAPCVGIEEGGCSLFDNCSGVGPVDPFVDMEGEVVVVGEMRQEHHEKGEAYDGDQEDDCFVFEPC